MPAISPAARASFKLKTNWDPETQTSLILEELVKLAERNGKAHIKEREKTIATWQGDRPSWESRVARINSQATVVLFVSRTGDPFGQKKWGWLDEGTRIRYMHVSDDWISKTKPGRISSGPGRGHITGLGFPAPGIQPRRWNIIINKKLEKRLLKGAETAVKRGLKRRRAGKFASITRLIIGG